jgi:hypothetical protein
MRSAVDICQCLMEAATAGSRCPPGMAQELPVGAHPDATAASFSICGCGELLRTRSENPVGRCEDA